MGIQIVSLCMYAPVFNQSTTKACNNKKEYSASSWPLVALPHVLVLCVYSFQDVFPAVAVGGHLRRGLDDRRREHIWRENCIRRVNRLADGCATGIRGASDINVLLEFCPHNFVLVV